MALINFDYQQRTKKISDNNQSRHPQLVDEVENSELRKLLGDAFLYDIQINSSNYTDLLNGVEFYYCGSKLKHRGLKFVLAYLVYAKYIGESFVQDTFSGFVQKNRQESETISDGTTKRLMQENRDIALSEFKLIEKYLNENSDIYTFWEGATTKKMFTPKFHTIRKTVR